MLTHEVLVWWKEWLPLIHVHLVKVAAVNLRKLVLLPLESSQVSHAYVRSILWCGDLQPSFHMCPEHTKPLIELFKEEKFLLKSMPYARILISSLMVPHLNLVVFYYKTTTWSCLHGTRVHMLVAEPAHVLELAIVVHSPRISQRHLVDLCCKLPFFFLDLMSLEYPDTNQIWISGIYDGWNVSQEL